MKKICTSIIVVVCINILILVTHRDNIFAMEKSGITISPVQYELTMVAGEQREITATLKNATDKKYTIGISFSSVNVEALIKEDRLQLEESDDSKGVSHWLSMNRKKFVLQADEEKNVKITIQIPDDTEQGGFYPAVVFQPESVKGPEDEVTIDQKIVSVLFINISEVKGAYAVSSGKITSFLSHASLVFTPFVTFSINFENTGETYMHPRGKIHIYDKNGMHLSDTPTINDNYTLLLQGQTLHENLKWTIKDTGGLIHSFGKYKAVLEMYHNPDQKDISYAETTFYVIPLWNILIMFGFILLFIGIFFLGKYVKRRYF